MSCDRRCFEPSGNYFGHDDCSTCPGRDDGRQQAAIEEIMTTEVFRALHWAEQEPHGNKSDSVVMKILAETVRRLDADLTLAKHTAMKGKS